MLILAYLYASVVLVFLHYCMSQNKQSNRHHYTGDVSGCVICTLNKFEYLDKEESYKNFTKEVILSIYVIFEMQ